MPLPGNRRALLVAVDPLPFSSTLRSEFAELKDVLLDPAVGSYEYVDMAVNLSANEVDLRFARLCEEARPGETLLLYCVGDLRRREVPLDATAEALAGSEASGAVAILDTRRQSPPAKVRVPESTKVISLRSDEDDDPFSLTPLFTDVLRSGAADLDADGLVEVDELYDCLRERIRPPEALSLVSRTATPLYVAQSPVTGTRSVPVEGPQVEPYQPPPPEPEIVWPDPGQPQQPPSQPVEAAPQGDEPAPQPADLSEPPLDDDVEWVNDAPAKQDLLRRGALADVVALRLTEIHADEPDTSVLVHLDGAWGTGKSTLLNVLEERLPGFLVTRYDAWQQSRVAPPWWTLLAATRAEIVRSKGWWAAGWLRLAETVARARRSGAPYVLALVFLLSVTGLIGYLLWPERASAQSVTTVAKLVAAVAGPVALLWAGSLVAGRFLLWDSPRGARMFEQSDTNPMSEVAAHFAWLIDRSDRPLVFFVDDLDRCHHEYVVEFLEAVQTLVRRFPSASRPRQVAHFVVAADGAWLRRSYEVAYQTFDESVAEPARPLGYLFLDKLFQLTIPMPELSTATQATYLDRMLRVGDPDGGDLRREVHQTQRELASHRGDEGAILETLNSVAPGVRQLVAGDAALALAQPPARVRTNHSLRKFATMLHANPRSMKKFLNTYSMLRSVRTLEGNTVPRDALALWAILLVRWPSLAEFLAAQPDAVAGIVDPIWINDTFPEGLRDVAAAPEVRAVITCPQGGPLTPALIRQCRGGGP